MVKSLVGSAISFFYFGYFDHLLRFLTHYYSYEGPRWASWNLGVFLCIRCAGIHRNLGVHISKVKSVNLDSWTPEQMAVSLFRIFLFWSSKNIHRLNSLDHQPYICFMFSIRVYKIGVIGGLVCTGSASYLRTFIDLRQIRKCFDQNFM